MSNEKENDQIITNEVTEETQADPVEESVNNAPEQAEDFSETEEKETISEEEISEEEDGQEADSDEEFPQDTDEQEEGGETEIKVELVESPYVKKQYLRFGADEDREFLDTEGTLSYLEKHGFSDNNLTQAREKIFEAQYYERVITKVKENVHYCDFCGKELGVEYDVLSDGRERCNDCSRTIVRSVEDLRETFIEVERNMEVMYGINYFASIDVKFVDSKKIARRFNEVFVPTAGRDPRTLGFAEDRNGAYSIWVENQSPYLSSVATIAHELTHIWQYLNWNRKDIQKTYYKPLKEKFPSMDPMLIIYEGMAKWSEVQYLFFINEYQRALVEIDTNLHRPDEYGLGFALYYKEYGLTRGTFPQGTTPFMDKHFPLHEY